MSELQIRIHNADTNETVDREMTKKEAEDYQNGIEIAKKADLDKENNRQSALAKLADLGLTEDEIAAL